MRPTPWGDLAVNDAHVHFFSHSFYTGLARARKLENAEALATLLGWEIPTPEATALAATWVAELDRAGVHHAALIASAHGEESGVISAVAAHPDRFWGFFIVDPTQPDAFDRVSNAVASSRLHCMCLFPAMHTYPLTDTRLVPLLEMASDGNLAVFVHCGALSVGVRRKLNLPSQFDLRYSNPIDLHPVALHFPKIRFIVPHFGAGMLREALMLADLCPNVFLDSSSSNRWMLYEGMDLRTVFRRVIDVVGTGRVLFGTDSSFFPRGWNTSVFDVQTKALYELGLDEASASQFLSLNLEQLFAAA